MKTADSSTVLRAVRTVLRGQVFLSDVMGRQVLGRFIGASGPTERSPISSLSNRELQIIHHIGESRDNRQIARLTGVSLKTVEAHRSRIKEKLSLRSTSDLIRFATDWVQREDSFVEQ
ncbi:MAG TPA: LuxR C-terminal-related transcriptional regulator [Opitutaceae bacterium]